MSFVNGNPIRHIFVILFFSVTASAANLSFFAGMVPFIGGLHVGTTLGLKPVIGKFVVPEFAVAYTKGDPPREARFYPSGSSPQRYDFSNWSDTYGSLRLKCLCISPSHPVYVALGIGGGLHLVGAKKEYPVEWHYQWQFQGHGFIQVNFRLDDNNSLYTEFEITDSFQEIPNPMIYPTGLIVFKFGLRSHSI
ncbi:hypothetical protein KKG05_00720 [bacterium]|nr:hypothetical protein [bacterium]